MEVKVGDKVLLKKPHPCGCSEFLVLRVGLDYKLRCVKCGREIMTPRVKITKNIKSVL